MRPACSRTPGPHHPPDAYEWTVAPGDAPDIPTELTIGFEGGMPVSLDGEALGPVELVQRVHDLGGKHGVGRIDHVEDRLVGIKSREIYETPAATILHTAHAALEGLTFSKEQLRFNRIVADETAQATYDGIWFSALHRDLREYMRSSQRVVNGQVRMRLDHGNAYVVGRRSDDSLYDRTLATYDADDAYDHAASVGFIKIFGLPLRTEAARHDSAWTWTEPMLGELPGRAGRRQGLADEGLGWPLRSRNRMRTRPPSGAPSRSMSSWRIEDIAGSLAHVAGLAACRPAQRARRLTPSATACAPSPPTCVTGPSSGTRRTRTST